MSERYSKLFNLAENLYTTGSPVIIHAGALLKDTQTGKILVQLKLRNISEKTIKATTVFITPMDTIGNPLGGPVTYQYLDLQVDRDADFGQKVPISLPDFATRSFCVSVVEVIFADNTVWNNNVTFWDALASPTSLDSLGDNELTKQFRIEYGSDCENKLLKQQDLWYCVCGAINHSDEAICHKCHRSLSELEAINMERMRKAEEVRIAQEQADIAAAIAKAQKEADIAAAKVKKIRRLSAIITSILAVFAIVIAAAIFVPKLVEKSNQYSTAVDYTENGEYRKALTMLADLGDYKNSKKYYKECLIAITEQPSIAVGSLHAVGIKEDGTVVAVGDNLVGGCDVSDWSDIVAVSAGDYYTVGLKSDGTVVAVGSNIGGCCDVSDWSDIITISVGCNHTVGLKSDGTVVAVGNNKFGKRNVSDWSGIIAISAGDDHTLGLKADGHVIAVGYENSSENDVSTWTGIDSVSAGRDYSIGLKKDGTVVAVGDNEEGQCNVSDWSGITAIATGTMHTVGLKADGTVVAVGNNEYGQCDVSDWSNIIAVSAGYFNTVGLKADGTIVNTGLSYYPKDVSDWNNIRQPK